MSIDPSIRALGSIEWAKAPTAPKKGAQCESWPCPNSAVLEVWYKAWPQTRWSFCKEHLEQYPDYLR